LPYLVLAQGSASTSPLDKLREVGAGASGPYAEATATSASYYVGIIIQGALALLGVFFIIVIVVAGYQWIMAGGNEDEIKKAMSKIKNAIIGVVVTLMVYAMWSFLAKYVI
jgi:hypothetical protein